MLHDNFVANIKPAYASDGASEADLNALWLTIKKQYVSHYLPQIYMNETFLRSISHLDRMTILMHTGSDVGNLNQYSNNPPVGTLTLN